MRLLKEFLKPYTADLENVVLMIYTLSMGSALGSNNKMSHRFISTGLSIFIKSERQDHTKQYKEIVQKFVSLNQEKPFSYIQCILLFFAFLGFTIFIGIMNVLGKQDIAELSKSLQNMDKASLKGVLENFQPFFQRL